MGDEDARRRWMQRVEAQRRLIAEKYWDERSGFFNDTIRPDGSPDESVRPNALVLLLAGVASDYQARNVLSKVEAQDITTGWGVRSLNALEFGPSVESWI